MPRAGAATAEKKTDSEIALLDELRERAMAIRAVAASRREAITVREDPIPYGTRKR